MAVRAGGDPEVQDCVFRDGKSGGIFVHTQGKGRFARCEVTGNALAGMVVREGGDPEVQGCTFSRNGAFGVWIMAGGRGTIRECTLAANRPTEWYVDLSVGGTRRGNRPEAPR
jgi:parallel beta-helix repeat protein